MAFEIIKSIVEAEERGEHIKSQATADAEAMKADALVRSAQIAAEAKKRAKQELDTMIQQAYTDSQPEKEKILQESSRKCNEIKEKALAHIEEASEAIIRKVVGKDGNCYDE